ncbi:hypothetical protein N7520_011886 [Penicillium odoratum]|uniref:uncharacterized protein n=1 Tax=Penicillium odoratum TaxID=1167516 RepID=UPI002546B5E6|nr:uncharacterized protein N7520_011886 [Penicillium odoratum]KAJ5746704.1 hypothetical protein N7520_011886 [Penicillium odoratum]
MLNPLDQLPIANGAEFDTWTDQHEDECLEGTRTELLNEIGEWAVSPQGKLIFWLNGMAGTGKSTISRTVAKRFKQQRAEREGILGASFFFKRGEGDRGNATKLFPTITRQLAKSVPRLTSSVQAAIDNNPDIATKGMREQFEKILLQPLLGLDSPAIANVVMVIDALDECDGDKDIRLILELLSQLRDSKTLRLRILLTSRPELPIRLGFKKLNNYHKDLALHEIPKEAIDYDLSLFLNHRLSEIREDRDPPLPIDWPGAMNIQKLVALSSPLFIFAATICRLFEDPNWDPVESLSDVLTHQNDESKLDSTYLPVLDRLLKGQTEGQKTDLIQEFHQVVGAIVILESPLSVLSLSKLIGLPDRRIHIRLSSLHSVLRVPKDDSSPVQLFHLSFRDFLLDPKTRHRSPFFVKKSEVHYRLTISCLKVCDNLQKNICRLQSEGIQRIEIDRRTIDRYILPEVQYACRYWAFHLAQCTYSQDMMHTVLLFLEKHFLHWVEAMCLLGLASEVVGIINLLQNIDSEGENTLTFDFLQDANRFFLKNRQIADVAPLQIYCSGLIFAPRKSIIREKFQSDLPKWISCSPKVEECWSAELQILEGHSGTVTSVASSPDGRLLAFGSDDCTVRLWDAVTGTLLQTLRGYKGSPLSVAFSADSRRVASGAWDGTVWVWDTVTGALLKTMYCHAYEVLSIAFSPDGRFASGSRDGTVRIWDSSTGALQETLTVHSGSVYSVSFSLGGRLLISGSEDGTVQLWDTAISALHQTLEGYIDSFWSEVFLLNSQSTSNSKDKIVRLWQTSKSGLQQTLEGHIDSVLSVAFSPDSRQLASGSKDMTVRLWDTMRGTLVHTLKGHLGSVTSIAFSPDSRQLASGSEDRTVRLWDPERGTLLQTLVHLDSVYSLAFLPGGHLASGIKDNTLRLWDPATGARQKTLDRKPGSVFRMTFSPDGRLLASVRDNTTIQLWNTVTGDLHQTFEGHLYYSRSIRYLHFSPDGRLLASVKDNIIQLWDTVTGDLHQTLESHMYHCQSIIFSLDSRLLASTVEGNTVQLWNTITGELHQTIDECYPRLTKFSPDSRLLASVRDNTIKLWDTVTGDLHQTLESPLHNVDYIIFSPDSRLLVSISSFALQLWETEASIFSRGSEARLQN